VSIPFVHGERDAIIIAFPVERVSPPSRSTTREAVVISLTTPVTPSEGDDTVSQNSSGEPTANTGDANPSERVRQRARNVALHALATRGVSKQEIEERLVSRDLPDDVVQEEISALERQGLIDDTELASNLVDKYVVRQGLGRRAASEKMRQRGISASIIAGALEGVSNADESTRLREVAEDRARALGSLAPEVAKRRLVAYLQRRGYSGNDIYSLVDEVLR
jgi:regulatory protein